MAEYTSLHINDINDIISHYDLGEVSAFKVLSGGWENTNYQITVKEVHYVLTLCEQKTLTETTELSKLLTYLDRHNFYTSKVLPNLENNPVTLFNGKPVLLKTFIDGKIMDPLPDHLLTLIGIQLGKLHKIRAPKYLPTSLGYGKEHFEEVKQYDPDSPFHSWLKEISDYLQPYLKLDPPKTLIHSDLFASNVIISDSKDKAVIMDFEEAAYYYRIFDLGMTFVGLCREADALNLDCAHSFMKGYQKEVQLTSIEKEALQAFTVYAAAAMSFWRHKNFNYTNPIASLKNHYKELQSVANYTKNLPANLFNKIINP